MNIATTRESSRSWIKLFLIAKTGEGSLIYLDKEFQRVNCLNNCLFSEKEKKSIWSQHRIIIPDMGIIRNFKVHIQRRPKWIRCQALYGIRIQQVHNEVENGPIKLDLLGYMRQKFEMTVNVEEMFEEKTVYYSYFVNYIIYI